MFSRNLPSLFVVKPPESDHLSKIIDSGCEIRQDMVNFEGNLRVQCAGASPHQRISHAQPNVFVFNRVVVRRRDEHVGDQ